jgi:ketosteroid isomerase-like protein
MTTDNLDVIRRLFRAVEERDVEPMFDIYDPTVVVREARSLPYGGEYHGHDGVVQHGLGYLEAWDRFQTDEDRRLEAEFAGSGDRVFVRWRQKAHGSDGQQLDLPAISVYRLREGRVVESIMHHLDTEALLEFLARQRGQAG